MPAQNAPPAGGGPTAPASPWAELSGTQRAIVLALLRHGRLSRPQIMSLVGISPGSVTRLTAPLIEQGLLTTRPERASGAGRPPSPPWSCGPMPKASWASPCRRAPSRPC